MFANFITALPTGAAMTFLILFGMQALISMQPGAAVKAEVHELTPWIYQPRDEKTYEESFRPEAIPDVVPMPPINPGSDESGDGPALHIPFKTPTPRPNNYDFSKFGVRDGPLVTVVRVQPTYPSVMSSRGIEGFVTVIFDVMPDGSVTNIAVLESSHSGFERSAMQAASRFKFKARVVDGTPQPSRGIRYRFTFEMDK